MIREGFVVAGSSAGTNMQKVPFERGKVLSWSTAT